MFERREEGFGSQNTIVTAVFLVLAFFALFWVARSIFTIMAWLAPVFLIITLIINYRIVLNYGKWLWGLLNNNPLMGVLGILLTVVGFPVVSFLLFGKALLYRKSKQLEKAYEEQKYGTYTEYEIIDEEPLELRELEEKVRKDDRDEYEKLFD
jgi:uncharacterized membrane protein YbaN (DUF454 family)